jgi:hypothetical protein
MSYTKMFLVALLAAGSACGLDEDQTVGHRCWSSGLEEVLSSDGDANVVLEQEATDCPSKLCLYYPDTSAPLDGPETPLCTALCSSDSDCPGSTPLCPGGFRCEVAMELGPFACQKMCICAAALESDSTLEGACDQVTP